MASRGNLMGMTFGMSGGVFLWRGELEVRARENFIRRGLGKCGRWSERRVGVLSFWDVAGLRISFLTFSLKV